MPLPSALRRPQVFLATAAAAAVTGLVAVSPGALSPPPPVTFGTQTKVEPPPRPARDATGDPCADSAAEGLAAWKPAAVQLAAKKLGVGGGFLAACNQTLVEWQHGHSFAVSGGRVMPGVAGDFCCENPPGMETTTRPDVAAFALAQHGRWRTRTRRVFVDAGANMFARTDKRGSWYLGSSAAFACGYPQGDTFELHAFEPNSPKYKNRARPYTRKGGREYLSKLAGLKWVLSYPSSIRVRWVGAGTKTGTMYLVGDGLHAHLVDEKEAYRNATPLATEKPKSAAEAARQKAAAAIAERWRNQKPVEMQVVSLADWLVNNTKEEDFVVLKIDIEGMEHQVLPQLKETGALRLVDELFVECHHLNMGTGPGAVRAPECMKLRADALASGIPYHDWH